MGDVGMMATSQQVRAQRQPIDIEQLLIWTYRVQKADQVIRRGGGLHSLEALVDGVQLNATSTCGCAAVARIQELGVRVDVEGRDAGALHPDAEVVHRAVMRLTARVQGRPGWQLIIGHAAWGDRPDSMEGEMPRPIPVLNRRGLPRVEFTTPGRRQDEAMCLVEYAPSAASILLAREEYAAWHQLLRLLALALQAEPGLSRFHPLAPAAPAAPWPV